VLRSVFGVVEKTSPKHAGTTCVFCVFVSLCHCVEVCRGVRRRYCWRFYHERPRAGDVFFCSLSSGRRRALVATKCFVLGCERRAAARETRMARSCFGVKGRKKPRMGQFEEFFPLRVVLWFFCMYRFIAKCTHPGHDESK